MFLSKKVLFAGWAPLVEEKYSTASSSDVSRQIVVPLYVGENKIFYRYAMHSTRSAEISNCAGTQTIVLSVGAGTFFADGDSTSTSYTFYAYAQTSSEILFSQIVINGTTESAAATTHVVPWAKTVAMIITMFGSDNIIWVNRSTSNFTLKNNLTALASSSSGYGYVGKPTSSTALVQNGNNVFTVTTSSVTTLFTKGISGNVKYVDGRYYIMLYSPTLTIYKISSSGATEWTKEYYCDENNTVPMTMRFLGYTNGKMYSVGMPTGSDPTSLYYKIVLYEIDMDTGEILHTFDLPTPQVVINGLITLADSISYTADNFSFGIRAVNRRFALPIVAGYATGGTMYHDWFIITVPE